MNARDAHDDPDDAPRGLPHLDARVTADGLPALPGGSRPARPENLPALPGARSTEPELSDDAPDDETERTRPGRGRRLLGPLALVITLLLVAGGIGAGVAMLLDDDPETDPAASVDDAAEDPDAPDLTLQQAISRTEPSVVGVRVPGGQGSGVIVWPDNLIVTNFHVVSGGRAGAEAVGAALPDTVTVITADDRRLTARIVTSDARADLAILETITDAGLGGVRLAEGADAGLVQGDQVFAIGTPFGLQNTVTAGIVSAVGRRNPEGIPTIQTDAPINPGNSGGGLFDLSGRLVGIPTSIGSPIPGNVGIGFAVPANRVANLLETVP